MPDGVPGYRIPACALQWIAAIVVLLMIRAGLVMIREGISRPPGDTLFPFHKNSGVLLIVAPSGYRLTHQPRPGRPMSPSGSAG